MQIDQGKFDFDPGKWIGNLLRHEERRSRDAKVGEEGGHPLHLLGLRHGHEREKAMVRWIKL